MERGLTSFICGLLNEAPHEIAVWLHLEIFPGDKNSVS